MWAPDEIAENSKTSIIMRWDDDISKFLHDKVRFTYTCMYYTYYPWDSNHH